MKRSEEIYEGLGGKPFSWKQFINEHKVGILGTIAFHLILLITFLMVEIQSLKKEVSELDIIFEYVEEEEQVNDIEESEETREEKISRLFDQQMRQSNRAVNINKLEEEISTDKYVEEVKNELESERSEEWQKQQEELKKILNQEDLVPVEPAPQKNEKDREFTGPTNISYEFLSAPLDRKSFDLPIPVYKCRGFGTVEVSIEVNHSGDVTSAKANVIEATEDPDCLAEVAEKFALRTRFRADLSAPSSHKGKIVYSFVAQ
ncbi:MAG: hypothetical protein ACOCZL_05925 [Bacteroidota bacterium]